MLPTRYAHVITSRKGNNWNETWNWTNDEIGVATESWLWVRIEVMAW